MKTNNMHIAKSVPVHLVKLNPTLWTLPSKKVSWNSLDLNNTYIISGSAFIDLEDPYGSLGNPFSVIIGNRVKNMTTDVRNEICQITGTPETVFINSYYLVKQ